LNDFQINLGNTVCIFQNVAEQHFCKPIFHRLSSRIFKFPHLKDYIKCWNKMMSVFFSDK
jgi:hypothetical protein